MQPDFIAHLKLVWHLMLNMSLLVLGILFLENVMDLLVDVLDVLNEAASPITFELDMGRSCRVAPNGQWDIVVGIPTKA